MPDVTEEWKWNIPVWSSNEIIYSGETYKIKKLTFFKGVALSDSSRLFNSSLEGNTRQGIDIHEFEALDEAIFKALIAEVAQFNKQYT